MTARTEEWEDVNGVKRSFVAFLSSRERLQRLRPQEVVEWYIGSLFLRNHITDANIALHISDELRELAKKWLNNNRGMRYL